ncbi:Amino acid permease [Musa troglodytarum]|uniref:Amino acid permease n=1 Tax=Musa troglodytarum TaxID=320322 RepID=A0A9E7JMQ7_9LILI|nr:Amino acid permease [Musa troglodytarum]
MVPTLFSVLVIKLAPLSQTAAGGNDKRPVDEQRNQKRARKVFAGLSLLCRWSLTGLAAIWKSWMITVSPVTSELERAGDDEHYWDSDHHFDSEMLFLDIGAVTSEK